MSTSTSSLSLDFNGHPYHPDLSPYPCVGVRYHENLKQVPADSFALPENSRTRITDQFGTRQWVSPAASLSFSPGLVRWVAAPVLRLIKDDPVLYARMQHYAKTGDAAAALSIGAEVTKSNGAVEACGNYAPTPPNNPPNFVIELGSQEGDTTLSRTVQNMLFAKGFTWAGDEGAPVFFRQARHIVVCRVEVPGHFKPMTLTNWDIPSPQVYPSYPRYSAETQFGEITRMLSTPLTPEIWGRKAKYETGGDTVMFGGVSLSVDALRNFLSAMDKTQPGNQTATYIGLSSGATISRDQIKAVLDYVEATNRG